ncbi:G-type lectin S-receptor-like serine/threonine-protein kinase At1g11300 isoform X1 [Vigna unguiculata]|uniref:G-type lectin S-receptor-like serine/threonine-protein kinase At1g11300 isoform X1 n=1 Tax=Vigna unguiculata TaxID=3917 RepID=UPI0010170685|nr:G-type lectin S-receptor-like serine/threonine-protein kinase At1g11300 isoform X1 [Vigna unguiculata]
MDYSNCKNLFFVLIITCFLFSDVVIATYTITSSQFIKDNETITSTGGNYTLGFFTPHNSTKRYVGIWWQPKFTVIWVANRNQPLNDSSGVVTISEDGNLVVLNGQNQVIWSTNVSNVGSNTTSKLLDSGNLVLQESSSERTIWESFQHPTNALLPNMKISTNKATGEKVKQTSWKSPSDPSTGSFSISVERLSIPELFIWKETRPFWRSGPWNGKTFTGIPFMNTYYLQGLHIGDDGEGNVEFLFKEVEEIGFIIYILNATGNCEERWWNGEKKEWVVTWNSHHFECDVYGVCGPFAVCNYESSPTCSCLKGFEPRNKEEWNRQNWTSGCFRRTPLQCERDSNQNKSADHTEDGFFEMKMVKVPDFADGSSLRLQPDMCRSRCLENCSCIAYSYDADIGCMSWTENLIDITQFSNEGLDLHVRVAYTELAEKERNRTIIIIVTGTVGTTLILICAYIMWKRISTGHVEIIKRFLQFNGGGAPQEYINDNAFGDLSQVKLQELLTIRFENLVTATNKFHASNKLGEGGFGPVYKGQLNDGREIAVKRLSRASGQGLEEFMNEVVVISKLQHRNLVRLLGCCIEGEEKMLIYEYMPNNSLDKYIFDPSKDKVLHWRKRFSIIEGVARGMLYLHRDSRLKIIHRDLKASNILLDVELNPKISDFGMARIFGGNEDEANTKRIVGTYGYMSPEYAMQGLFSEKSDVFSFGVLLLEIVSGRRNSSFYDEENYLTLLGFAWIQWTEDNIPSLIDPGIYDPKLHRYFYRCIHLGLLCVQEYAADRPNMATVISMLNSEIADLPPPRKPAFILRENMLNSLSSVRGNDLNSLNSVSISDIHGR